MRKMYNYFCALPLSYVPPKSVRLLLLLALMFGSSRLSAQTMSGTYTVCSTGCNYNTIDAALADLKAKGVSGAVTINIAAGTYTETLAVTAIPGASATNTITFAGVGRTATKITYNTTQAVRITSAAHITFKNMTIEQTGTPGTKYAVYLTGSSYITFDNCHIKAPVASTTGMYALYTTTSDTNTYKNCRFEGGYYGVYISQSATTGYDVWDNCKVANVYYYGFYQSNGINNRYNNLTIDSMTNTTSYGLYMTSGSNRKFTNLYVNNVNGTYGVYSSSTTSDTFNNANINCAKTYALYMTSVNKNAFRNSRIESKMNYAVYMSSCNDVMFSKSQIIAPITSSTYYALYATSCNRNIYKDNIFRGGYYTIYNYQYSTTYAFGGDIWENNRITQAYYYGMYTYGGYNNEYIKNYIDSTGYYGLYSYYEGGALYNGNVLPGRQGPGASAIYYIVYMYYPNYHNATATFEFYNNMIGSEGTPATVGHYLYNYGYNNLKYNHNTIHMGTAAKGYNLYFYPSTASTSVEMMNNNFSRSSTGPLVYYYYPHVNHKVDGNNYYNTGGSFGLYNAKTYGSFGDYKKDAKAFGHDQSATFVKPTYVSPTDLHLDQSMPAPNTKYAGLDKDIDGDTRCKLFTTAGADESTFGKTAIAKAGFSGPDTVIVGSPTNFYNTANSNDPNSYKWYVNGVMVEDSINLLLAAPSTGALSLKLVTESCAGKDSFTRTIRVVSPSKRPTARFLASNGNIVMGEIVRFSDISRDGASSWKWEISPDSSFNNGVKSPRYVYLFNTNANSQHPVVQFLESGRYKVCLTATNSLGSNTLCRADYILVQSSINLGKVQTTTDSSGWLYDDGGISGEPLRAGKTTTLIAPCASDVYLIFKYFDYMCGYNYLRIYDGDQELQTKALHPCTSNTTGYGSTGLTGGSTYGYCYSGTNSEYCVPKVMTDTFHAKSGKMLIVQDINYAYTGYNNGFEAYWWSKPKANQPKPNASFTSADSICINKTGTFTSTTTGDDVKYFWDLDNDISTFEATTQNVTWPYNTPGTYTISLVAQNCGGADTFTKDVVVYAPAKPKVKFSADNTNPTVNDIVFLSSDITQCVDKYRWSFTSATGKSSVTFVNKTTAASENPQVIFTENGCYTVKLYAENTAGADSLSTTCFVNVKNAYCVPTVASNIADIGISKVTINTISSSTTQGISDYQNFIATRSTTLDQGVTYKLTVERTSATNEITRTVWIDWNADGDFNDAGEKVAEEVNKPTLTWTTDIKVPTTAKIGATVLRIAVNDGSYANRVCGQNEFGEYEDYRVYIQNDLTAPVITLLGDDTVRVERGYTYTDAGATAKDNLDGDVTSKIVTDMAGFNNKAEGTYIFTYNVKDAAGNIAKTVSRVVIVTPDVTAPTLTVATPDTMYIAVFGTYTRPAVISSTDLVDGPVTPVIADPVNVNAIGTYKVTYTATDKAGNVATVVRTVIVVDTVAPVIVLNGVNPVRHSIRTQYVDAGYTVTDNYYSNISVTVTSNVDVNKPGTYSVVYTAVDPSGNVAKTITRTVIVEDMDKPVITLVGDTSIFVEVNTMFNDPGAIVTDNNDKNLKYVVSGSFYQSFPNGVPTTLGNYTVVYTVTDAAGNIATTSRTIVVRDTKAPVITLNGEPSVNVCRWSPYTDAGYTVNDNFSPAGDITVTQEGNYIAAGTDVEGVYSLRYKAVDKSGNIGYSAWRNINVTNPYEFPCKTVTGVGADVTLDKLINIYPNPNTGKFTVEANLPATEQVRISVVNLLGQEVAVISNGAMNVNTFQVDLSNQKAGVYMLNIVTDKQTVTKRVVVTK